MKCNCFMNPTFVFQFCSIGVARLYISNTIVQSLKCPIYSNLVLKGEKNYNYFFNKWN